MFLLHQELGVKHPLHRKKLQLALQQINSTGKVKKMDLDHHWVTRKCSVKARVKKKMVFIISYRLKNLAFCEHRLQSVFDDIILQTKIQ